MRVPGRAMGVEDSCDDVVITKVKKKVKVRCEIEGKLDKGGCKYCEC